MKRIFRYEVPVDDKPHYFELASSPLSVGCRKSGIVEFWAWGFDPEDKVPTSGRWFQVFGTGHAVQPAYRARHWGTVQDAATPSLIWHLVEDAR